MDSSSRVQTDDPEAPHWETRSAADEHHLTYDFGARCVITEVNLKFLGVEGVNPQVGVFCLKFGEKGGVEFVEAGCPPIRPPRGSIPPKEDLKRVEGANPQVGGTTSRLARPRCSLILLDCSNNN